MTLGLVIYENRSFNTINAKLQYPDNECIALLPFKFIFNEVLRGCQKILNVLALSLPCLKPNNLNFRQGFTTVLLVKRFIKTLPLVIRYKIYKSLVTTSYLEG